MGKDLVERGAISVSPKNYKTNDGKEIKSGSPVFLSNSYGKVRSRYLRAATGSCHDLCKYGRKDNSGDEEKHIIFGRFMANSIASDAIQCLVKDPILMYRRKKLGSEIKAPDTDKLQEQNIQPDGKQVGISDNSIDINMVNCLSNHGTTICSPKFIPQEELEQHTGSLAKEIGLSMNPINSLFDTPPTAKKIETLEEDVIIPINPEPKSQEQAGEDENAQPQLKAIVVSEKTANVDGTVEISSQVILPEPPDEEINNGKKFNIRKIKKKQVNNPRASPVPKASPGKSKILKEKSSAASTEPGSLGNANIVLSNGMESITSAAPEVIKQKNAASMIHSASPKLPKNIKNASLPSGKSNASAKPVISLKIRSPLIRSIPQLNASRSLNALSKLERKTVKNNEMAEVGEAKVFKPRRASISSTTSLHNLVTLQARKSCYARNAMEKKEGNAKDDEQILAFIESRSNGTDLDSFKENFSKEDDGHACKSAVSETCEFPERIQRKHKLITSKGEYKNWARRTPVQLDDGSPLPYKLKFKRGQVAKLRATDCGTRRLIDSKSDDTGLDTSQENLRKEDKGDAFESAVTETCELPANEGIQWKHKRSISNVEYKRQIRRTPSVHPDDSSSSPYKLKFKRGKVIELRAADIVGPRRLRFRRGRTLSEDSIREVEKRSFRRRADIRDSNDPNSESHSAILKQPNLQVQGVMLKHQDAQGKKDMQALFNHVIEETASKLVESRKSKVKALVGAFETVISLQETRSASAV